MHRRLGNTKWLWSDPEWEAMKASGRPLAQILLEFKALACVKRANRRRRKQ